MRKSRLLAYSVLCICVAITIAFVAVTYRNSSQLFNYSSIVSCVVVAFVIQWIAFVPSYLKQTERFYDITGTITFILVIAIALYSVSPPNPYQWLIATLVIIWALRLGIFLFLRIHQDGNDDRFDEIKTDKYRFFMTWTIQGLWAVMTSGAAITAIVSSTHVQMGFTTLLGLGLWFIGFSIEVLADIQKRQFKQHNRTSLSFISSGLWSYSRHPNYLGEILLWIGVAIIALPAFSGWQYAMLISPLFVIVLLTKVSGIPLLEAKADKKWHNNPDYQAYKRTTPTLVPRFFKGLHL
jgi:steroid 5-alpha reductase family enzyme